MSDVITWLYLIGVPVCSVYALRLWVLDARMTGQPVTKSDFSEAVLMAALMGMIWPIAVVLIGVGLAVDWWLDRA
jgi:hypothetical protein